MATNSESILNDVLSTQREDLAPELTPENFFEIFAAMQATKEFELSYEEIESGIVDGEHDGGIDAIYTFVNGDLIDEELNFPIPKKNVEIELIIIQSKSSNGFAEKQINSLISSTNHLLNLTRDYDDLIQYNSELKIKADIFRGAYRKLAAKFPSLRIKYIYAAKKASESIHENTREKSRELVESAEKLFDEASVEFLFWGAKELLALARTKPKQTFELKFDQSLNGANGYVALVKLPEFYNFLCGGSGTIRNDLFESNVRDYQGTTEVNQEISKTLESDKSDDFWWFNNGVTVLASRANSSGSVITIENPQIVNGLQTSSQIGLYFAQGEANDPRTVMVKVVASEDEEVRDRIIKATNNQNPVPLASLRATDKVQRDIEHHLKANGLFYDRRKNFYKNEGRPASKIVSINLLAQAVMTLFRGEPDNARARPSSLIKDDDVYKSLFSEEFPLDAYLVAADCVRRIELDMKSISVLTSRDRNNLRFYVLYWLIAVKANSISLNPQRISSLKGKITTLEIKRAINEVNKLFVAEGASDQTSKGPGFKIKVIDSAKNLIIANSQKK